MDDLAVQRKKSYDRVTVNIQDFINELENVLAKCEERLNGQDLNCYELSALIKEVHDAILNPEEHKQSLEKPFIGLMPILSDSRSQVWRWDFC